MLHSDLILYINYILNRKLLKLKSGQVTITKNLRSVVPVKPFYYDQWHKYNETTNEIFVIKQNGN